MCASKISETRILSKKKSKTTLRVAATAIVYYRRFFARNAVRDHDPRLIAPVALYLAAKAEEHTLAAKIVVQQMTEIYHADHAYPYTVAHVYDYEFKLIAALEFDLIIYHPYRPMIQYCADASFHDLVTAAWPILNDSYRTDACLRYPPYLIAIACIYIAGTLQNREMTSWVKKINIDLQELADITQYLSVTYANPNTLRPSGPQAERINNKLQSHFGPKIQNIQSGISKKPPSSSRPKMSLKLADDKLMQLTHNVGTSQSVDYPLIAHARNSHAGESGLVEHD
ncbi:Cyclin [Gracilaria domingensis]|nr:Cyclin [Gracilaria domingensis]